MTLANVNIILLAQATINGGIYHLSNLEHFTEVGDTLIRTTLYRSYNTTEARPDLFSSFDRLDGQVEELF
jgi:hypothetical protein